MERFNSGDLVLVGSNIPHYRLSDEDYYQDPDLMAKVVLVQFDPDLLGNSILHLPEMTLLADLLRRAGRGIQIVGDERNLQLVKSMLDDGIATQSSYLEAQSELDVLKA